MTPHLHRTGLAAGAVSRCLTAVFAFSVAFVLVTTSRAADLRIDPDFPGGNLIVERIDGDTVHIRPDVRETKGRWFYWCFRVRDAGSRTLTFKFTVGSPIGMRGPALSKDGGLTWTWLGLERVKGSSFSHTFSADTPEVLLSVGMTYTEQNLRAFIARVGPRPDFVVDSLGRSDRGRNVELLRVGKVTGAPAHRVVLTARHHACEMMASYLLEGIVEGILAEDDTGRWLRENVAFLIAPMMDKDGVEEGLQGKNRLPHDPCRDYVGEPRYATVAAMKKLLPAWADGRLRIALDLHCPALRNAGSENIHFVGGPVPEIWQRVGRFSQMLERTQKGPLVFRSRDNLPHGSAWNKLAEPSSFNLWAAGLPGINFSTTLEFPYAAVRGSEVNAATARLFGRDLASAIRRYLTTERAR